MRFNELTNLFFLLLPFLGILLLYIVSNAYFLRVGRFPLNSFTTRQVAQSKQQGLQQQRQIYFVLLFFIPLMLGLGFYNLNIAGFTQLSLLMKGTVIAYALIITIALLFLWRCVVKINRYDLSIQAEQGTANLFAALPTGFITLHDVPIGHKNPVAHIVIAKAGVFLVNVLVQPQPFFNRDSTKIRASYFDKSFYFPNGRNKHIVKDTQAMAVALQTRLRKLHGDKITVKPILTLPGWYLEKKEKAPIIILPTQQMTAFIASFADRPDLLDELDVEGIQQSISDLRMA